MRCIYDEGTDKISLREFHHPLRQIFEKFPRAVVMEQRAMEEALGVKISRVAGDAVGDEPPYIDFILS
jgi:ribosomal protein L25 (general stress protein Ctc)